MKKDTIKEVVEKLNRNYLTEELFMPKKGRRLPERAAVIEIIRDLRQIIFPGYFGKDSALELDTAYYAGYRINHLYDALKEQITIALRYQGKEENVEQKAQEVTDRFFSRIPDIQNLMLKDVQAGFDGDPAAQSREEIIFSYPGLFAVYVYRIAHVLYGEKIPFIPRIMSEYAHGRTGIDINPGARICQTLSGRDAGGAVYKKRTEACRTETTPYHRRPCDDLLEFHRPWWRYRDRGTLHYRRKYFHYRVRAALHESKRQEPGTDFQNAKRKSGKEESLGVGKLKLLYLGRRK